MIFSNVKMACQHFDIINNVECKNKCYQLILFNLHNKYYCYYHYNNYYKKIIILIQKNYRKYKNKTKALITIQKIYRGYKCRRLLNNIYKKLPSDLQLHVLFYITEKHYYNKYLISLGNIISKKILHLNQNINYAISTVLFNSNNYDTFVTILSLISQNELLSIYKLYPKYHCILKKNQKLTSSIINLKNRLIMFNYNLYHSDYIDIYITFNHFYKKLLDYLEPDMFISDDA